MRKLTLLISMLFLSLGMAWAQTATLEVSTNVAYPEYQYKIKNNGDNGGFWMGANTAPTQNNVASFAFFAAEGDNAYKIYSIDKKQWVSYDKEANSSNCKNFAVLVDSKDNANAWKITEAYRRVDVYQMQPFDSDGNLRAQYMNWYQGVENGGGGYSYDDERTVGLWKDNAASDNGSGWILVDNNESVASVDKFVNGTVYTFVTARGWMGAMDSKSDVISTARAANAISDADVKRTNPDFQWTVYKSGNDKYYLYNIGKGQFMGVQSVNNAAVPFVATPAGNITFKKSWNTDYPIMFSTDNKAVVNHSANHDFGLISWADGWNTYDDPGSNHKVVKVGVLDNDAIAGIAELVNVYELLPTLNAAVSELTALFSGKDLGNGLGQYSSSYENYEAVFAGIKEYAANVPANATVADIQEKIDICKEIRNTFSYNKPVAGKYYRIKAVAEWNDEAPYLGSKNSTAKSGRAEFIANADAYSIFLFDGTSLKSYASGHYLVNNSNFLGYNGVQQNGSSIAFHLASNNLKGAYNISFKGNNDGTRWLYVNQGDYTDAAGNTDGTNGYCFNIEEVAEAQLPVAQSGNNVYYSLADAKANVKAGETLTLFVDTDETIELPLGVILDKNGHSADNVTVATPVAKIGEQGYATLAAAVKAASAGATITFVKNINESVTLSKNVTIDGANFNYTGTMSANNGLTVTVQNVNFVNGGFSKNNGGTSGTYTIKDCTFDGQGKYAYPVVAKNIGTLNVENCTVEDYQYGFLYVKQQSTKVSVKNVAVEGCSNYAVYLASGVAATIENLSVKNSNNGILWPSAGARTLNLSGCKFENVKTAINSNGGAYVVTANIKGVNNDFGTAVLSDNVKCVLAEDATLAATAGLNVTTNVEGKEVAYKGGVYSVVVKRDPTGHVAYRADVTDKDDREGIAILLKEVYAKNSLVVKVYNGETLMFTCTRRDIDDEDKVMFPVDGNTTANVVLWGKESGSWINEIAVAPTELNVPNRIEIWADNVLVQNYTHDSGTILGTNLEKYLALDCVKKYDAKVGEDYYETLAAAVEAAQDDATVELRKNATGAGIVIDKSIEINFGGNTYTFNGGAVGSSNTKSNGFQIMKGNNVTLKNGTLNVADAVKGEFYILIQNYANLAVEGMNLDGTNLDKYSATDGDSYVLSNNSGTVNVAASTITANNEGNLAFALDACDKSGWGYELPEVTVAGDATVNGNVEVSATLNMNGTLNGNIVINGAEGVVKGAEGLNVTSTVADYELVYADGVYSVVEKFYAAKVGEQKYETLAAAVEAADAGATVELLNDATGAGVVINKSITIDFGGKAYTVNQTVGSTGTTTLGLQILKDNTVTLKNGTLTSTAAVEGSKEVKMLVQNYANLTVEDMNLVDATDHILYVLSNNSGNVEIKGRSVISSDAVALDACKYASYAAPTVNVAEGVAVNGNVEVSATLNMNGTLNGTIVINGAEGKVNGAEGLNVTAMDGYNVAYAGGVYTVVEKHYVAQVGGVQYETFAAAVKAAPAGGTVTLIDDATEAATVILTKNLTIDGADKTFTGAIEFKKSNGYFTIKNVKFNGAGNRVYALKSQSSTTSLTVENCEATGYTYGFLYANSAIANVTVTDVTVKDVNYGVHSARGTNVTLNNFVAENVTYGVMVQNYSGRNVVLNNCSFTGSENPLYIWERNQTYKITFNFKGANEMGKADYCTSAMAVVNADAIAGTKVCGTLAEAVAAAEAGETVALLRNVQLDALLTIDKSITLDLGVYNITRDARTALYVEGDDVEVTINGEGTVSGKQALYVGGGLVKVNGGNFHGLTEAVYVQHSGKAEIYGGKFSSDNVNYVLNEYDSTRETSDITVYGGTFVGFNPADNAAEGNGTNFVAEGYDVVDNGDGTYTVKENPAYGKVAKVGEEYYATLAEALAAAAAGTSVELIADVNEDVTLTKNVTINGANFKYTGTMSANTNITVNVLDLNFVNAGFSKGTKSTNGNYTFQGCTFDGQGTYFRAIYVRGANKVVLENCTAKDYDYFMYVSNSLNNSITVKDVTVENCGGYAMMFNSGAGKATFENFTVKNTPTAIIYNNSANRALTLNNCTMENVNTAIRHTGEGDKNITCTFVGKNDLGGADFSEYVVLNNAALAGTVIYSSLAEAVAAEGNEVKLLGNSTGAGVVIDEDLTIDFNGKTYSFNGGAVGSSNTKSNGFQILKDNNVTLKNGTLNVAEAAKGEFYILIQNYANLTVKDMTLDGTNLDKYSTTDGDSYVLSNNSGNVVVEGNTNITANNDGDKAFAFDACDKSGWGYELPVVKVYTTGKIAGGIENSATIELYSGTYTVDVNEWCAEGYAATKGADNLWTVIKAIAQVGEVKYASIQAAIDAAQDGDTVTLLANVKLTDDDVIIIDKMKTFCHVPEGKNITFDMNGKEITVSYNGGEYLYGVFLVSGGMTVTGNGKIDIPQTDRQVAYMFLKRGTAGYLVIENGNFHAGNLEDSMIYTNGDKVVTVNGGTFFLDSTGERPNGCPWIFNTKGQNANSVVVNGGTYNTNVSKQHYVHEAKLAEDKTMLDNGDGTWTVIEALAAIDGVGYRTLADAVEAAVEGDYVTLLKDVTDAGIVINKSITIDFGGHTYTFNKAVGSKGTETLGFQILKDNYVFLTNGTLTSTAAVEGKEIKVLVQNYANLTLEDMNLVDATDHILYALSNNSGETYLTRNTNITTDAVAFDSYYSKYYNAPTVNVETTGTITGAIEKNDGATIAISSGTFTAEILPEWCAEYHVPVQNADGTWTVESRYIDELTIVDDGKYTYDFVNDMTVGEFTYTRTFPAVNMWQTAYFPFEIPVEVLVEKGYEVGYFYDIHFEFNDGEINMDMAPDLHVMKVKSGTLRANYPYVIKPTAEADLNLVLEFEDIVLHSVNDMITVESSSTVHTFEFAGLYTRTLCSDFAGEAPCYTITTKGKFTKISKTANLTSLRVYMTIKAKDGSPVIFDETNAPEYIRMRVIGEENEDGTTTIYDVNAEEAEEMIFDLSGRRVLETEKGIYIKNGKKVYVK